MGHWCQHAGASLRTPFNPWTEPQSSSHLPSHETCLRGLRGSPGRQPNPGCGDRRQRPPWVHLKAPLETLSCLVSSLGGSPGQALGRAASAARGQYGQGLGSEVGVPHWEHGPAGSSCMKLPRPWNRGLPGTGPMPHPSAGPGSSAMGNCFLGWSHPRKMLPCLFTAQHCPRSHRNRPGTASQA